MCYLFVDEYLKKEGFNFADHNGSRFNISNGGGQHDDYCRFAVIRFCVINRNDVHCANVLHEFIFSHQTREAGDT